MLFLAKKPLRELCDAITVALGQVTDAYDNRVMSGVDSDRPDNLQRAALMALSVLMDAPHGVCVLPGDVVFLLPTGCKKVAFFDNNIVTGLPAQKKPV